MNPISYNTSPYNAYTNPYYQNYSGFDNPYSSRYYTYEQPENPAKESVKTLGLAALLQLISSGLRLGTDMLSARLASGKEFTSADNVVKVAKDMVDKNKLDVTVGFVDDANKAYYTSKYGMRKSFEEVAKGRNAFFTDKAKLAVAPSSKPSLILHELGHAINAKKPVTKLLQNSRRYAGYAPMALLLANDILGQSNDGKKNFVERNAGVLGFCAFLPTIIEEGLASFRGIKAAKKTLKNPAGLKILKKNYLAALGTYILAGIGLGIASKQTMILSNKDAR